ncbi:conserved Plasmodium protein, unknown function [Plasmodium reichenowi]|uniref:General stress protein FMN-binding split barrel domain-containing protein n=1 Tax=Plasmodium reichenowi TaxID=5854 RepID=A0A060S1U8_PLARE|nr:conserved Plasmodium protein, unknown function [Plasmodium reichenowi]
MNILYKKLFANANITSKRFLLFNNVILKRREGYLLQKRNLFFFKNHKNDIIKNEIEEILKRNGDDICTLYEKNKNDKYNEQKYRGQEKFIHKKGKFKRLFLFIGFQSIPIIALMYLFKYIEEIKLKELNFKFDSSEDIINEAIKLINGSSLCFCLYFDKNVINTVYIEPLNPENAEINYERYNKEIASSSFSNSEYEIKKKNEKVMNGSGNQMIKKNNEEIKNMNRSGQINNNGNEKNMKVNNDTNVEEKNSTNNNNNNNNKKKNNNNNNNNNIGDTNSSDSLKNLLYSLNKPLIQEMMCSKGSMEVPLNYMYFCISKNTDIYDYIKNKNKDISLLYSDEKKNIYATLTGNASIIENEDIKNIIWTDKWRYLISGDYKDNYILIKFTPSTVLLKTIGLKNEHWKSNIVRRSIINDKISWVKI